MSIRDDLNIAGRLTLRLCTPDGRIVEEVTAHNDITLAGRTLVASLFNHDKAADPIKRVSKMKVGSSGKDFDAADAALGEYVDETPIITPIEEVPNPGGASRMMLRLTGELPEDADLGPLKEAGLFTDDDVMYNRVTFETITKSDKFKLTLVWEITF